MTTGVRLYLFHMLPWEQAAWQRCHIKDINCRNNVMKRWDLLNMAPVVRVERGWPWSHRWVRILPLICSVQMPPKRRASAGVAPAIKKAKRGRASSIAASGPALPDPTPPVSESVIDNIADRVLARIEERLALRLMPPKCRATSRYSSTTQLGSPGTTGACSPERRGQLPPATGPVPKVQTRTAPRM